MKKGIAIITGVAGLVLALATSSFAADGKEVTVKGDGKCAKCALKETDECQNVIQTKEDGIRIGFRDSVEHDADAFETG